MPRRNNTKPRTPSGQLSRAGVREYHPAQVRRMLDDMAHAATNPLGGYEVGRLCLAGHLTTDHVATAARYAELWRAFSAVSGSPSPNARSAAMDPIRGGGAADIEDDRARAIKRGWHDVYVVLLGAGGDRLAEWVFDVVIRDTAATTSEGRRDIKAALDAIGAHWRGR